ncbi:hypothetical protein ACFB49_39810 [Sphingomonas sp. DBB INV C78]|uniref:VOC family protein n=1 Tax=Sphingomonas sp. DBB INV C78 TaxID=3349434 RepID=UPI0036D29953
MPIAIVSVPVADQDRAKSFYVEVMNFAVLRDDPMGPTARWIQLQPPGGGAFWSTGSTRCRRAASRG